MKEKQISDRQLRAWRFGAVAAPIAHLAAGCSWPVALTVGGIGILIGWASSGKRYTAPWLGAIQWFLCMVAAAEGMRWMGSFWAHQPGGSWVSLILLGLAVWAAARTASVQAGVLLLWFVGFLLGSVAVSAIPEIKAVNLLPGKVTEEWEQGLRLLGVILLPGLVESPVDEKQKRSGRFPWVAMGAFALLCSICTQGVLSARIASMAASPFYELSRSVRFYGAFQRFESLAAMGMMLGMFLYLSYLCTIGREAGQHVGIRNRITSIWMTGLGIILFYIFGTGEDRGILTMGILAAGYILPWIGARIGPGKQNGKT